MRILVSGANGFIGSNLCNRLIANGDTVYGIVRDITKVSSNLSSKVKIIGCDLNDWNQIESSDLAELKNIDVFYHLAWGGTSTSFKNDFDLQFRNVQVSFNAIRLAKQINVGKFIGIGSASEFAYSSKPIDGYGTPSPSDLYGAAKTSAKYFCETYAKINNMDYCWCYLTSVYGPGRNDDNLITYTIKSLLKGESPKFTKLEQRWDYIYIDDLTRALELVGEKGVSGTYYAIGSGEVHPLSYYVSVISQSINPNIHLQIGALPYKTNKIDNSIIDIAKIESVGFRTSKKFEDYIFGYKKI